jgi:drug/metabolite transporter (DMT)-like permease
LIRTIEIYTASLASLALYCGHEIMGINRPGEQSWHLRYRTETRKIMSKSLSRTAFLTLLLIAVMMGANHVSARFAFNDGVSVTTAVIFRSGVTALIITLLLLSQRVSPRLQGRSLIFMPIVGTLVAIQSYCLYSAVARLPVALALLAFNTYPLWAAFWARIIYRHQAEKFVLKAMPVILFGLALALDAFGAASGLGASAHWQQIGNGVAFATTAAATFALAMVLTQHELLPIDGRVRTVYTLGTVLLLTTAFAASSGDWSLPSTATGWWGLAGLTVLYGTAFTLMFSLLPRLGVVGNSAIMNVEPVFALALAWLLLGQAVAPVQVLGAMIVVTTVIALGLRKQAT